MFVVDVSVTGASGANGGPAHNAVSSSDQSKEVPKEFLELTLNE